MTLFLSSYACPLVVQAFGWHFACSGYQDILSSLKEFFGHIARVDKLGLKSWSKKAVALVGFLGGNLTKI